MTYVQQHGANISTLAGLSLGAHTAVYSEQDAALYALAVGAAASETSLIYERSLRVLPTYALALGLWAVEAVGALGAYDPVHTLHVAQRLIVQDDLPPAGAIEMKGRVEAVWDKGEAAVLDIGVAAPSFETTYRIWVPGAGGFGGERGPSTRTARPERNPDARVVVDTSPEQAALYRLTGDRHPIHIDPDVAVAAGFERPILHGLCLLGIATLAIARAVSRDACGVRDLSARFAAPVYPGATVEMLAWGEDAAFTFAAEVAAVEVISGGRVVFTEPEL